MYSIVDVVFDNIRQSFFSVCKLYLLVMFRLDRVGRIQQILREDIYVVPNKYVLYGIAS